MGETGSKDCCVELITVLKKYELPEVRVALLTVTSMTYCMNECIPDALRDFREDIPKIEEAIKYLFGAVDQMIDKGRKMGEDNG